MNKKYGFEREFFVKHGGQFVLVPIRVPMDSCGLLAEARGEPHTDPMKAAYLLLAEEARINQLATESDVTLFGCDFQIITPQLRRAAIRRHGKDAMTEEGGSLYGHDYSPSDRLVRAGMHVHFSRIEEVERKDGAIQRISTMFDFARIIRCLDEAFKAEIKAAKRLPGLYEIKGHGFEYRSLPATIDPKAVASVINDKRL